MLEQYISPEIFTLCCIHVLKLEKRQIKFKKIEALKVIV